MPFPNIYFFLGGCMRQADLDPSRSRSVSPASVVAQTKCYVLPVVLQMDTFALRFIIRPPFAL